MESVYFSLHISVLVWVLLSLGFLCALFLCVPYRRRISRIWRTARRHSAEAKVAAEDCVNTEQVDARCSDEYTEPVSIVVRAHDDAATLATLLPVLLSQKYAPGYEVIVVNEGSSEPTAQVVDALRLKHHNLYITFTPGDAYNLSSKKLAVMLGVKAARNNLVVLTTANVSVDSPLWLSRLTRHFTCPATEVVLGYSAPDEEIVRNASLRRFNHGADAITWLSAALAGQPYRGTECALAFTTEIFFRNKGFSRSLNLRDGIDDIFVSEIVTPENTVVELGQASQSHFSYYRPAEDMRDERQSHEFTGRFITHAARRFMDAGAWALSLMTLLFIASAILAWPNLLVLIAALVCWCVVLTVITLTWNRALRVLSLKVHSLLIPIFVATSPIRNVWLALNTRRHAHRNYTYQK